MKKTIIIIVTFLVQPLMIFGQQEAKTNTGKTVLLYEDGSWLYSDSVPLYNINALIVSNLEIPKTNSKDKIIVHSGYSLLYNEKHEQANWIAYHLTKEETYKHFERTDKFIPDPDVKTGTASSRDYEGSGYDRGHLAPASDMGYSSITMTESFYYSNMSPQLPSFNRGIWKHLEELVRVWAVENNSIYIVTGPVLSSELPSIGPNKVSIPNYFYKVIIDYNEPSIKSIGFVIPNIGSKEPLQSFAVTVDSVEKITGIDFFSLIPDEQEELIEKTLCVKCWPWKISKSDAEKNEAKKSVSMQCSGITKAGERCRNNTLNVSGYCYHHEGQIANHTEVITTPTKTTSNSKSSSVQCSSTTKAGNRCKRMTTSSNGRCFQH